QDDQALAHAYPNEWQTRALRLSLPPVPLTGRDQHPAQSAWTATAAGRVSSRPGRALQGGRVSSGKGHIVVIGTRTDVLGGCTCVHLRYAPSPPPPPDSADL